MDVNFRRLVSLLLFSLAAHPGGAATLADWERAVVKVLFYPCLTGSPRLEGSGLLVRIDGRVLVVTSEHVLIHESAARTCHEIASERLGRTKIRFVRADYLRGLGLLEASVTTSLERLAIDPRPLATAEPPTELIALGFPSGSSELQVRERGRLVSPRSSRSLIPLAPSMLEAEGLFVEFGFSGGLLIGADGRSFAGMLTHQYLRRESGKPTVVDEIGREVAIRPGDLALAVTGTGVLEWLMAPPLPASRDWIRRAESQLRGFEEVCFDPLCFSVGDKKVSDILDIGGDGAGIGGDGAGIGGDAGPIHPEILRAVSVRLDPSATTEPLRRELEDPLLESYRLALLKGQSRRHEISIGFLREADSDRLVTTRSLGHFLTRWRRDGFRPIAVHGRSNDLPSGLQKLNALARALARKAQARKERAGDPQFAKWFESIRDRALLVESSLSGSTAVAGLLGGENEPFWGKIYQEDFDGAVDLESDIQALVAQMKKLGL